MISDDILFKTFLDEFVLLHNQITIKATAK